MEALHSEQHSRDTTSFKEGLVRPTLITMLGANHSCELLKKTICKRAYLIPTRTLALLYLNTS